MLWVANESLDDPLQQNEFDTIFKSILKREAR
ncbi:primase C-terminal domain-containing protein [Lentilactobacillus dabitei]